MTTLGLYDHGAMIIENGQALIPFLDFEDGTETLVEITSPEEARLLAACLRQQLKHGFACLEGEFQELRGTLSMTPGTDGEGLMLVEGKSSPIPVKLLLDMEEAAVPSHSVVIALGVESEGAYMIAKIAMKPIQPSRAPEPDQAHRLH